MANRRSYIGVLYRTDPDKAREEILRFLKRQNGVVLLAAKDAGLSRRNMQRYLHAMSLWEELAKIRETAEVKKSSGKAPPEWLTKSRAALGRAP